ncbi:MAG: peptidoglycan-binding protein [Verrucomicrobiota bacterium]|nr:peptidoglycan-binding protein [Verrucomicrobiota bacterium]
MRRAATFAFLLISIATVLADGQTETIQRALKDQGFYYGEITGKLDTDTTAAIRRYQIRNGLKVSGELDAETAKSLGVSGHPAATKPAARPAATPRPLVVPAPRDLQDSARPPDAASTAPTEVVPPPAPVAPYPGYAPGPHGLRPEVSGLFDGTPFAVAPPDVQRRVMIGAQTTLARRGFYRGGIDGIYGRGMQFAVRAYQSRAGLQPSGLLDMDTLASLGLLPGQHAPGFGPPRRSLRLRPRFVPDGERIYEPY